MKALGFLVVLSMGLSSVLQAEESKGTESDPSRPCVVNFSEEGSFFKGKTYRT